MKRIKLYRILKLDKGDAHFKRHNPLISRLLWSPTDKGSWRCVYVPNGMSLNWGYLLGMELTFLDSGGRDFLVEKVTQKDIGFIKMMPKAEYEKQRKANLLCKV